MNKGRGFYTAAVGAQVEVKCTGDFHCMVVDSERIPVALAGPFAGNQRHYKFILPEDYDTCEVVCEDSEHWEATWRGVKPRGETVNPVPIETHLDGHTQESETDRLRRMIQAAVTTALDSQTAPTLEEENDFDMPDNELDPFGLSGFEVEEMEEEYIEGSPVEPPPKEKEPSATPPDAEDSPASVADVKTEAHPE